MRSEPPIVVAIVVILDLRPDRRRDHCLCILLDDDRDKDRDYDGKTTMIGTMIATTMDEGFSHVPKNLISPRNHEVPLVPKI